MRLRAHSWFWPVLAELATLSAAALIAAALRRAPPGQPDRALYSAGTSSVWPNPALYSALVGSADQSEHCTVLGRLGEPSPALYSAWLAWSGLAGPRAGPKRRRGAEDWSSQGAAHQAGRSERRGPKSRGAVFIQPGTISPGCWTSAGTGHQLLGAAEVPDPPVGTRILEPLSL